MPFPTHKLSRLVKATSNSRRAPLNTAPPVISGTAAAGQTLSCTQGTWIGNISTYTISWFRDGVPLGATGSTYVLQTADIGYPITASVAVAGFTGTGYAMSAPLNTGSPYPVTMAQPFTAANGTLFSALGFTMGGAGGSQTEYNKFTVNANQGRVLGIVASGAPATYANATVEIGSVTHYAETTLSAANTGNWLVIKYINEQNYVSLYFSGAQTMMQQRVNNVATNVTTNGWTIAATGQAGTVVRAEAYSDNTVSLFVNGVCYAASTSFGAASVANTVRYPINAALASGTRTGIFGNIFGTTTGDNFTTGSLVIPLSLATAVIAAPISGTHRVTVTGTYSGNPAGYTIGISRANGQLLHAPTLATLNAAGGSFTAYIDAPAADLIDAAGSSVLIQVRQSDDANVMRSISTANPVFQRVFPFAKGMNEAFIAEWSNANVMRDAVAAGSWRDQTYKYFVQPGGIVGTNLSAESSGMGYDGIIHQYPAGSTQILKIFPGWLEAGDYQVTYPAGMTCTMSAAPTNLSVITPFSAGSGVIRTAGGYVNGRLQFTGTIPVEGLQLSVLKVGDAHPERLCSDSSIASYTAMGSKIVRFMTALHTNSPQVARTTTAQIWQGPPSVGPVTTELCISMANNTMQHLWFNVDHLASDEVITALATKIKLGLNPSLKCYIEFSNECWNTMFQQTDFCKREGSRLGFFNANGSITPIPDLQIGSFNPSGGALTANYATGTHIYGNLYGTGWQVWRANKDNVIGAGDAISALTNAAWTVVATNPDTALAGKRYYAYRSAQVFALFTAVFGATTSTQLVRVGAWWAAGGYTDAQNILSWQNYYRVVDRWAIAPYWGGGFGGYDLGTYATNYPGWGATEKALVATDPVAFRNAFFAMANLAIDGALAATSTYKHGLARWLNTTYGLAPDAMPLISYECNWHVVIGGAWNSAINVEFGNLVRDARMGTAMTRYATGLKEQIGAEHIFFDRVGPIPTTGTAMSTWGIQENETDITATNHRYTALAAIN